MTANARPSITVVGQGEAEAISDVMRVDLGIECDAESVTVAFRAAGDAVAGLLEVLTAAGIAGPDLQTSEMQVNPRYGEHGPNGSPIIGYTCSHSMTAIIRDLDQAPSILSAAAQAGNDAIRIRNVGFTVADRTPLATSARALAFADAQARAEQYAALAGVTLGAVIEVSEATAGADPSPRYAKLAASMPIQGGTTSLSASVRVVYAISD